MSEREGITQVPQDKWATVSDLLKSLMINEQMSDLLTKFWLKKSKILFLSLFYIGFFFLMSDLLIPLFLVSDVSESLRSLTKNERCERIAQVAHQKWANERITLFFEQIAHSLIFGQKTTDLLRKLMSEFPAL